MPWYDGKVKNIWLKASREGRVMDGRPEEFASPNSGFLPLDSVQAPECRLGGIDVPGNGKESN